MRFIKKFDESVIQSAEGFTVKELKQIIENLPDYTPVLLVDSDGEGTNQFTKENIKIDSIIIADATGIAYTPNMTHIKHSIMTKGLLIHTKK
jgi:hypothetical protein